MNKKNFFVMNQKCIFRFDKMSSCKFYNAMPNKKILV